MQKTPNFEAYVQKHENWREILLLLRQRAIKSGLLEAIKWGAPVYTLNDKNIVGLRAFKHYAGVWFFNGALILDRANKLINAQEGKTKNMRQWRFTVVDQVDAKVLDDYLSQAIDLQVSGQVRKPAQSKPLVIPTELRRALKVDKQLEGLFGKLAPYKQKEFVEYITEGKRKVTRIKRLEKSIVFIKTRTGLNDRYRSC